jgi:phosphoenolpyruvate-protein kinase (PTS system EI component)/CheY-like chemotaxis protein
VAVVFTATTLCGSPSQAFALTETIDLIGGVKAQTELRKDLYAMPAELGSLVSLWEPPAGTSPQSFVVQIQDAHANPEGQQNVAGMLKYLETKFPGLVVGLEGAAGELHPEYLNFFREFPDANRAVIDDLKQKGELNGAELFLLGKHQTPAREIQVGNINLEYGALLGLKRSRVYGVENAGLYRDDLRTYRDLLFKRDEMQALLDPIRAGLEKESSQKLNGELRDFLKERSRRKEGRFDASASQADPNLQAYVHYLQKQSLKFLEVDLKDPIEQLRFPSLLRVVMIEEARKGFDLEKVRDQWQKAVQSVKSAAKDPAEKEFAETFATFGYEKGYIPEAKSRTFTPSSSRKINGKFGPALYPRKLLEELFRFAKKHQLSFNGQESFWESWKLAVFQAEIDVTELLAEMNTLEEGLIQKLARSGDEKTLVRKLGNFDLLEKTLRLELNREEYNKILLNQDGLRSFTANSKPLAAFLDQAYHFYDISLRRDEALVTNLLALPCGTRKTRNPNESRAPSPESRIFVLYTGGFHTPGIETILRQKGIGYAVFSPRITNTDHGEMYQKVMSDANADLSTYFEVRNPFATKQEAIFFKEILEVAAPALFDRYKISAPEIAGRVKQAIESHPVLSKVLDARFSSKDQNASLRFQTRPATSEVTLRNASVMPMALTGESSSIDGKVVNQIPAATRVLFYSQEVLGLRAEPEVKIMAMKTPVSSAQTVISNAIQVAALEIPGASLKEKSELLQPAVRAEMRTGATSSDGNEPSRAQKMVDEFVKLIFFNGEDTPTINLWKIFTITEMYSILDGMQIPIATSLSLILEKLQTGDIVTASQDMSELLARLTMAPKISERAFFSKHAKEFKTFGFWGNWKLAFINVIVQISNKWLTKSRLGAALAQGFMKHFYGQRYEFLTFFVAELRGIGLISPESLAAALGKIAFENDVFKNGQSNDFLRRIRVLENLMLLIPGTAEMVPEASKKVEEEWEAEKKERLAKAEKARGSTQRIILPKEAGPLAVGAVQPTADFDVTSAVSSPSRDSLKARAEVRVADEFVELAFLNGGDIPAINLWKIFTVAEMYGILDGMQIPIATSLSLILEKLQTGDIVAASQDMSELLARLILAPKINGPVFADTMTQGFVKFSPEQRERFLAFVVKLKEIGLITPESLSVASEKLAASWYTLPEEKSIELLEYAEEVLKNWESSPSAIQETIQKIKEILSKLHKEILLKLHDEKMSETGVIKIETPEVGIQKPSSRSEIRAPRSMDVYLPLIEAETAQAVKKLRKQRVWKNVEPEMVKEILESMPFEHLDQAPLRRLLREVLLTMALTEEYWAQGLGHPYFLTSYQTDPTDREEKESHTEVIFASDQAFLEGHLQSELFSRYPVAKGEKMEVSIWGNGRSAKPSFHFHVFETWIEKKAQKKFSLNPKKLQAVLQSQPEYRILQSEVLEKKYGLLEELDAIEKAVQQKATVVTESERKTFEPATGQKTILIGGAAGGMHKVVLGEAAVYEPSDKRINISMVRPYDTPKVAAVKIRNETAAFQKIAGSLLEKEAKSEVSLSSERISQIFEEILKRIRGERIFAQVALRHVIQEIREQGDFEDLDPSEKRAVRFFQDEVLSALEKREDIIFDDARSGSVDLIRLNQERFGAKLFEKILKLPFGFNTEDADVIHMEKTLAAARRGTLLGASSQDPSVSVIDVIMNSIAGSQRGLSPKIAIQQAVEKHVDPFWMMYKKKVEEDAHPTRMTVRNFEFIDQVRNFWLSIVDELDTYDFIHKPNATADEVREAKEEELSKHQKVFAATMKQVTNMRPEYKEFDEFIRREIIEKGRSVGYLTARFFFEYYQKMKAANSLAGEVPSMGDLKATDDDLLNFLMHYYDYAEYGYSFEDGHAETPYVVFAQNIRDEIDYNSLRSRFRRRGRIVAIVSPDGTLLSHFAIFAQKEGIIAVPSANFAATGIDITQIKAGTLTLVDGRKGLVALNPSDDLREQWLRRGEHYAMLENFYLERARKPVFFGGKKIAVGADEASVEAVDAKSEGKTRISRYGADFIGLMRLEEFFLHMREQYAGIETDPERLSLALRKFIDSPFFKKSNRPLIVRLYDPQGDKLPPKAWWGKDLDGKNRTIADMRRIVAKNRSIRFYIDPEYPEFSEYGVMQIQAVLAAYVQEHRHKGVQLLIPDVVNESDTKAIQNLVERAKDELEPGQREKADLPVGFMYERQGAYLSPEAKFYGIGSNDLLQDILQLSRDDPKAASRLRQLNPKLVQEIYRVGSFGEARTIPVTLEGEWAGSRRMMLMLLLMRLNDVSVTPVMKLAKIPELKEFVRNIDPIKLQAKLGNYFKRVIRGDASLSTDEFDRVTQSFVDEVEESIMKKPEYLDFVRKQKEFFEREKLKKELDQSQSISRSELRTFMMREIGHVATFGPLASGEHAIRSLISSKRSDQTSPGKIGRSEMREEVHGKRLLLDHPEYGAMIRKMIDDFFLNLPRLDFQREKSLKKLADQINAAFFNGILKNNYRQVTSSEIKQYHAISQLSALMLKIATISDEKVWGEDGYGNIRETDWKHWVMHDLNNFIMVFLGFLEFFKEQGDLEDLKTTLQAWEEIDILLSFHEAIGKSIQNESGSFFERIAPIKAGMGDSKGNYLQRNQMLNYFGRKIFVDSPFAKQNKRRFVRAIDRIEPIHRQIKGYVQKIRKEYEEIHGPITLDEIVWRREIEEYIQKIKERKKTHGPIILKKTTLESDGKPTEEKLSVSKISEGKEASRSEARQIEDRLRVAKLLEDTINNKTTALQPDFIKITSREGIKKSVTDLLKLFQVSEMTVAGMPFVSDIIEKFKKEIDELEQWKKQLGDHNFVLGNEHREAIALLAQRIVLKNKNEVMPWLEHGTSATNQETIVVKQESKIVKRILVADDEAGIRAALEMLLRSMGYVVIPAEDGKKAFELLKKDDIDFFITDLKMPGFTGVQILKAMANGDLPKKPAILMTGYAKDFDSELKKDLEVEFVAKPNIMGPILSTLKKYGGPKQTRSVPNQGAAAVEEKTTDRSEMRELSQVERPLDMSSEEAALIKKIFVFGSKGIGFEKLGEDAILYVLFVEQILKKFPNAEIHMAIDYANLFSRERFRGKVFPVIDSAYELKRQKKEGQESFEPHEGILTHVNVPDGAILEAMEHGLGFDTKKLGEWLRDANYDMVFDFTGVGKGIQFFFEKNPNEKKPVIFSNMNTVVQRSSTGDKTGDRPVTMLDSSGLRDVRGTGEVGGLTRDGTRPDYWEKTHRVYRELGLYERGLDLQLLNGWGMPLSEVEKRWVLETVKGMFIKKQMDPQTVLTGREKFVYVNIFSQGNSGSIEPAMWVKLLSGILEKQDVYLIFSQGGFKDQTNQPVLRAILEELSKAVGPSKTRFLLEAPENISVGRVQEIMQTMDLVITPDTGFSHLATASNIPQLEFMMLSSNFSQWGTYRKNSMIVDSEFLENLSRYPEAGYGVIQRFIRDSLDASTPPRRRRALSPADFAKRDTLQRSELRQSDLVHRLLSDQRELFHPYVGKQRHIGVNALSIRMKDLESHRPWISPQAFSNYRSLISVLKRIRENAGAMRYVRENDINDASELVGRLVFRNEEDRLVSRHREIRGEFFAALGRIQQDLKRWGEAKRNQLKVLQALGENQYSHPSEKDVLNSLKETGEFWLIALAEVAGRYKETKSGFYNVVKTKIWPATNHWLEEPLSSERLDEVRNNGLHILETWHKYVRLSDGKLQDNHPAPNSVEDGLGSGLRGELFRFWEGLNFMAQAVAPLMPRSETVVAKPAIPVTSQLVQSELPLFRAEMRVADTEAFKTSLSKTASLVDSLPVPSEVIVTAEQMGAYSAEDIAAELEGGITEANVRKSRLWITMKLLKTMNGARQEGKITNKRLQQFLNEVMASVPDIVRAAISKNTVDGPKFHVNLTGLNEQEWSEFVRNFPVVLGMLVTLRANLSINVEAEGDALRSIQKKFDDLMTQEGITLAPGQLRIVSTLGGDRFKSFEGQKEADAFMARSENLLLRRKNVRSYWITEDKGRMDTLAAGIATALLEVVSDAHLNTANTYKPSDYATLLATVINAIQGYLQIQTAA